MTESNTEYSAALIAAFAKVLSAEESVRVADAAKKEAETIHGLKLAEAETELATAWKAIEDLMAETGEFEVTLPGSVTDYKIAWSKPRESVKVVSPDAVPDEFVKVERRPRLKDIGDHLKALPPEDRPNWASLEMGERKLGWKAQKKGAA